MKLLLALAFLASLGLFAAAQAPATPEPSRAAVPAASAGTVSIGHATGASVGRPSGVTQPAAGDSVQLEQTQPSARNQHHWLRWAIVSVAAILGVIAIIAINKNVKTQQITTGLP